MLAQRIHGLALGYEAFNDHEQLRSDPLFALLASKGTLNRSELALRSTRYHEIDYLAAALDRLLADVYLESLAVPPNQCEQNQLDYVFGFCSAR
jgi:hypothetical protein